jgi:SPX domain protein involved in polyphosphate accumulation
MTTSDLRFERKFFISDFSIEEVTTAVELHPDFFSEIFEKRYVNNVYFDTDELSCYHDNIEGKSERVKLRIRWYGNFKGLIEKPILEIKIKKGQLGNKISIPLESFVFNSISDVENTLKQVNSLELGLPVDLSFFKPSLLNRYARTYHLSADKKYRVTLDQEQKFLEAAPFENMEVNAIEDTTSVILELKYAQNDDDYARTIISKFPFRLTRSSKYVRGLELLHG